MAKSENARLYGSFGVWLYSRASSRAHDSQDPTDLPERLGNSKEFWCSAPTLAKCL